MTNELTNKIQYRLIELLLNFHYFHLSIYKGVNSRELRELESSQSHLCHFENVSKKKKMSEKNG